MCNDLHRNIMLTNWLLATYYKIFMLANAYAIGKQMKFFKHVTSMSLKLKHGIVAVFSFVLLISSIFIPSKVNSLEEEKSVKFGFPFAFVTQDFSKNETTLFFVYYQKFDPFYEKSSINSFSIINFISSFFVVFATIEILIWFLEILDFKIRKLIYKK